MKKSLFIILLFYIINCSSSVHAQNDKFFIFGIKMGGSLSNLSGFDHNNYVDKTNPKLNFVAGITTDFTLSQHWTILSGLEYTSKGAESDVEYFDTKTRTIINYNASYLQIPIHIGYKVKSAENSNVIFHLGPYFSYGVGGDIIWREKSTTQTTAGSYKKAFFSDNLFKRFDYGLGIGVNVDTKNFALNVGYDLGLNNITGSGFYFPDRKDIDPSGISIKTSSLHVTLGYKFRLGY